jgi:S1-C subfamily serine protease
LRGGNRDTVLAGYEVTAGGDLITAVEGKPVTSQEALTRALAKKLAGEMLELTVLRDGRPVSLKVTLGAAAAAESRSTRF